MKNVRNLFALLVIAVSLGSCAEDAVFEELEMLDKKSERNEDKEQVVPVEQLELSY